MTEGKATILTQGNNEAFYNPAQVVNRDLSIAVINHFQKVRAEETMQLSGNQKRANEAQKVRTAAAKEGGLRILEGLAATGLRSIRYAKEIDGEVERIVCNDLDPTVVESMKRNIEFNGVGDKVEASVGDARVVMLGNQRSFDVVDLDPYGAPVTLLDSAMECVSEGGLLLCTATDGAALCGNNSEACYAKYASYPLHKPYCHEQAIRILLSAISRSAARYKRFIVPVLSLSIDFYVRVFVRVYSNSATEVKNGAMKLSYVYQSQGCDSFYLSAVGRVKVNGNSRKYLPGHCVLSSEGSTCPETGAQFTVGGPIWNGPIHDHEWIKGVMAFMKGRGFAAEQKIRGILTSALQELPDVPLHMDLHNMCKILKCSVPPHHVVKSALINAGYRTSGVHCSKTALKTDAPWDFVWDVMRAWIKEHPTVKPLPEGSAGHKIANKTPGRIDVNFSRAPGAVVFKGKNTTTRFVQNPAGWGPKTMHGKKIKTDDRKRPRDEGGEKEGENGGSGGCIS